MANFSTKTFLNKSSTATYHLTFIDLWSHRTSSSGVERRKGAAAATTAAAIFVSELYSFKVVLLYSTFCYIADEWQQYYQVSYIRTPVVGWLCRVCPLPSTFRSTGVRRSVSRRTSSSSKPLSYVR